MDSYIVFTFVIFWQKVHDFRLEGQVSEKHIKSKCFISEQIVQIVFGNC